MNGKRPYDDRDRGGQHHHKKQKYDHQRKEYSNGGGQKFSSIPSNDSRDRRDDRPKPQMHYQDAIAKLPPATSTLPPVHAYTPFTVPTGLPPLPEVTDPTLASAPFKHKSTSASYNRSATNAATEVTYEKLEFLGDAQLEHMASRLLYTRYPYLLAGQQSQLRELLVKNETLAEYARAYSFDKRVQVGDLDRMIQDVESKGKGNKGFNKVLGDVFEAYVAAVVLSHGDDGFDVAEKWMTALWAPKLVEAAAKDSRYRQPGLTLTHDEEAADPLKTYNPTAKTELQKLILAGKETRLDYEPYQKPVELKGDQLGQNKHFIAVYLTGYGHERKLLGKGEGRNKVEAGNWAAQMAMHGETKGLVEQCAKELAEIRERKKAEKEAVKVKEKEEGTDGQ